MKYYCSNCKSEITTRFDDNPKDCYICHADNGLVEIPDFETLAQYEKRTGNKWNGAVWVRTVNEALRADYVWEVGHCLGEQAGFEILCAASPVPPPDNYVPEVEA